MSEENLLCRCVTPDLYEFCIGARRGPVRAPYDAEANFKPY
jgi:hypothetical protein